MAECVIKAVKEAQLTMKSKDFQAIVTEDWGNK